MSDERDQDANHDAMMRAFERLRSEIAERRSGECTLARRIALALVERALTTERTLQAGPPRDDHRRRSVLVE
ncbi:MAG: hypothetical protein V2J24_06875 [Pseudomonadales bacterium]|jgi:hypothetical protein|nr:hypothetical protein [Pseudomonadales bacterium]